MYKCVICLHFYAMLGLVLPIQKGFAQNIEPKDSLVLKNGISKPSTLATHPFGILFYTLPHNFKVHPSQIATIDFQLSSGNVWGQPVTTYIPTNSTDRVTLKNTLFFSRAARFDFENDPTESYFFQYDGVIKDFRIHVILPLGDKNDLTLSTRSFLLTDGKFPLTLFTGDRFIEFFHSNFAGGEDPFGRKRIGLDEALITYEDRNGRLLNISNGDFVFSGIESAYYYYPKIRSALNIQMNIGAHLGINLSRHNTSVDVGTSLAGIKEFRLGYNQSLFFGAGLNLLRKSIVSFNQNQTDLGTNTFFGSFEGHFEFTMKTDKDGHHSIGLNYRIQTPYNNKREEAYYVPFNPDRIGRWHEASRHLYKYPSYWSLIYSFTKKTELSIYLQQDMLVNNTPDFQMGVGLKIPFSF